VRLKATERAAALGRKKKGPVGLSPDLPQASTAFPPVTVTVRQARALSGLTHGQIYQALNEGFVESRKVLGRRLIVYASLERFLMQRADDRPPIDFAEHPRGDGTLRTPKAEEAA
jgi:hypothetical protein